MKNRIKIYNKLVLNELKEYYRQTETLNVFCSKTLNVLSYIRFIYDDTEQFGFTIIIHCLRICHVCN